MTSQAEYITVGNRNIPYKSMELDIYEIDFYKENPRINYIISKLPEEEVTSDTIYDALLRKDATKDLIRDIFENGGLIEPILVLDNKVIEGNTRLCAYRRLHSKEGDDKWKYIKAHVINEPVDQKTIFSILSTYHIKGKNPWDPFEKAACIKKMQDEGFTTSQIAKMVGSNKSKVESTLKAYTAMKSKYLCVVENDEEWNTIGNDTEHLRKYSYFDALYTNKDLSKRAEDAPAFIDEFVEWIIEGRIPKAQDVRELDNILNSHKAKRAFRELEPEEAFPEAINQLHWNKPGKVDPKYKIFNELRSHLSDIEAMVIKQEVSENPHKKTLIKKSYDDLRKFCKDIGVID